MTADPTLRVTPAELAGVAGQVRALARTMQSSAVALRSAVDGVDPPDAGADQSMVLDARAAHAALGEVSDLLGTLLADLGQALERQAAALAGAADGYAYVEQQVGEAFRAHLPRHE
jgi:hypothetical protein